MRSSYSVLVQSKFFNPAFNSAIFDGPVRIYFSQFYESLALKLYFAVQEELGELLTEAKEAARHQDRNVLVMLYPNPESFALSFEDSNQFLCSDHIESDQVIGVNGSFEDNKVAEIVESIGVSLEKMLSRSVTQIAPVLAAEL